MSKKIIGIILVVFLIGFIIWDIRRDNIEDKNLHKYGKIVNARITDFSLSKSAGTTFSMTFFHDGYSYNKVSQELGINAFHRKVYLDKNLLLLIDTTDLNNILLLIRPKDFQSFNIPIPDSLSWILNNQ